MASADKATGRSEGEHRLAAPSISLPKGGGAIRGIGEKFAANPVTGTGAMTLPITTSPGRSGFGAQLSLSYDSSAGNGPFGFGWSLSLPQITRKTDKGLPKYQDASESDVFILSGAEDLVPVLVQNGDTWEREVLPPRAVGDHTYHIQRYRPRIEGLFARLERWTNVADPADSFWRSISKDNITTWYGKTPESRLADPADPTRIFSWLICQSYDDKGNAILYGYVEENSDGVNMLHVHEKHRTPASRAANRYLKRIRYGNRETNLNPDGGALDPATLPADTWMFEVVFDYGEHHTDLPLPHEPGPWPVRHDPFSSYRAGFEVRTYRLCQRVLMFHHFPDEADVGANCLVRSTDFTYAYEEDATNARNPIFSLLLSAIQCAYKRHQGGFLKRFLPPVEFQYTEPTIDETIFEVDPKSLDNLPYGLDGSHYQWVDLDGEGLSGILTEQADGWFYKRNLSANHRITDPGTHTERTAARFSPVELVATKPNATLTAGQAQFMDLAGDGQTDLVELDGPMPGFYERTADEAWEPFQPFVSWPHVDTRGPHLKFIDLTGDGHADILISEDQAFVWHASLAEAGFGPAQRVHKALDENRGPQLVFADVEQTMYLADLSGDGLTDLVRIRNGEICYWPNLGYGRFAAKVTMDNAPWFDSPEQFDQQRLRLADIDGSGLTDILYLGRDGVSLYFNQSGNGWSKPRQLAAFPHIDSLTSVQVLDLLGNGTACLVWSSPLPGDTQRPMRYLDLMGGQKPHLLIKEVNNLGAETHVQYAPSTKFYLADKLAGKPWITRLPFPVHVVERVETRDRISGNRFVTRYAYHHGYFDGPEREFRGFGMVEQLDTEAFSALTAGGMLPDATNIDKASHVPPVLTRTWFHTGAFLDGSRISKQFEHEYYREGDTSETVNGLTDTQLRALLLDDTLLPSTLRLADGTRAPYTLSTEEVSEVCRALKGAILRQEVYALDGTDEADRPYSTSERNYTIELLQPRDGNKHAVFFTHAREQVDFHYERKLVEVNGQKHADPRVSHAMTLEVDALGNVLRAVAIGYRRRDLPDVDAPEQKQTHLTLTVNRFANRPDEQDWYRIGLPVETRTYEIVKPPEPTITDTRIDLFPSEPIAALTAELFPLDQPEPDAAKLWPYEKWDWRINTANAPTDTRLRLIEQARTLYRPDDLGSAQNDPLTLLPLGELQSLALPGESYKLAFTPGLLTQIYQRPRDAVQPAGAPPPENLLPNPVNVLSGQGSDRGGYRLSQDLKSTGAFPNTDPDNHWWIPSGRIFFSPGSTDTSDEELAHARPHFFLPHRYRDPFHTDTVSTETVVTYDRYDLLMLETRDALDNRVMVGERDAAGNLTIPGNDYRVLQPKLVTDPNRNRTEVAFDTLGMVVATALQGKDDTEGDNLTGLEADLTPARIDAFCDAADPHIFAVNLLKGATTRIIYNLDRFKNTGQPVFAATLARETHVSDPLPPQGLKIQISFSYSDGFDREIQKKIQAEPGPVPKRDANGKIIVGTDGQPVMTPNDVSPRWVGSGWTIFNNKGKPVRQYEPFFTDTHRFDFDIRIGVSPVLFYDPVERVVATLHPNHTWEKVVFDPWQQETWDVSDTVLVADPKTDPDVGVFFRRLPEAEYRPTWHALRTDPTHTSAFTALYPDPANRTNETHAVEKAAAHADTPATAYFDTLGRPFLTVAHNKVKCQDHDLDGTEDKLHTRVELDIEGNQRTVRDAIVQNGDAQGRIVMHYDYDMLGNPIHQACMEAGERWMLNDVAGKPLYAWDSRNHQFRTDYDPLRRPLRSFVTGADPTNMSQELLTDRLVYGEEHPEAELRNLRGQLYLQLDQAGVVASEANDFKGNPLRASRRIVTEYKQVINWNTVDAALPANATLNPAALEVALAPLLEADIYTSRTRYDALNRPTELTTPHTPAMQPSVIRPGYNEANLLERVEVNLRGAAVATPFVTDIDYDAKGQRTLIDYGNGVRTTHEYDLLTFRLAHLKTLRGAERLQELFYTYDPAGNITHIRDDAQQTIYFNNRRVEPSADYTYDAIYRLIEATGREHLGQIGGQPNPPTVPDAFNGFHTRLDHPGNGNAMGTFSEQYVYDAVGNFLEIQHRGSDPVHPGWTRAYTYTEPSLIEPGKKNNRLSSTIIHPDGNQPMVEPYTHDAHGNMTSMPHLSKIEYNFQDQLQATSKQVVTNGGSQETTSYVYDAAGQRIRKVTERQATAGQTPKRMKERIYLGGFEIYREYGNDGNTVKLERETLHVMDDQQRIALLETRTLDTAGNDPAPPQIIRYQFGNHLGSASLELDDSGQIISYEEYFPYGSTSYHAGRSTVEVSLKRYRYTGMERDEESGLQYHSARYYAPWKGRWVSVDPAQAQLPDWSPYCYSFANPIGYVDPDGNEPEPDTITVHTRTTERQAKKWAKEGIHEILSKGHAWLGTAIYTSNSPEIPGATAKGNTLISVKIRADNIVDMTKELGPMYEEGLNGEEKASSKQKRIAASYGSHPKDEYPFKKERGTSHKQNMDKALRNHPGKTIAIRMMDGSTHYAIRDVSSFVDTPKIEGKYDKKGTFVPRSPKGGGDEGKKPTPDESKAQSGGLRDIATGALVSTLITTAFSLLTTGELPSVKDVVVSAVPLADLAQAKNHDETVVPIILYFVWPALVKPAAIVAPIAAVTVGLVYGVPQASGRGMAAHMLGAKGSYNNLVCHYPGMDPRCGRK